MKMLLSDDVELGQPANPYTLSPSVSKSSAFAAVTPRSRSLHPVCANYKHNTHTTDYCIAPGGKLAGRTIDEAHAAQRAAKPRDNQTYKPRTPNQNAHVTTSTTPTAPDMSATGTIFVNGLLYVPDTAWNTTTPDTVHIVQILLSSDDPNFPFCVCLALSNSLEPFLPSTALSVTSSPVASSSLPFIIDTASCHISPILSDFKTLRPISPHPIKGLEDHSVNALDMGTIELHTPSGALVLNDAFYVPNSTVHLISVFLLGNAKYSSHFYPDQGYCFISNTHNNRVVQSSHLSHTYFLLNRFLLPNQNK
jgi:hypothetical protein